MSNSGGGEKNYETRDERIARLEAIIARLVEEVRPTNAVVKAAWSALTQKRKFRCRVDLGKPTECTYSAAAEKMHVLATSVEKLSEAVRKGRDPLGELRIFCGEHKSKVWPVIPRLEKPVFIFRLNETLQHLVDEGGEVVKTKAAERRKFEEKLESERISQVRVAQESSPEDILKALLGVEELVFKPDLPAVVPFGEQTLATSTLIPSGMGDALKERVGSGNGKTKKATKKESPLSDAEALAKANALSPEDQRPS